MPPRIKPEGPLDARIALIGEASGADEERSLRPFTGPAGQELDRLLHSAGLTRSELYITNVIKERPWNNEISRFIDLSKNPPRVTVEAREYIAELQEELSQSKANVFVPLGNTAMYALTGQSKILRWRGSVIDSTLLPGRKVVPTIHPRAVLGKEGVYLWRHLILFDLRRAMEESAFPDIRNAPMRLITEPTFYDAKCYIEEARNYPIVDVDIETLRGEISCVGISYSPYEGMSIPFVYENGDYWNLDQEAEIWRAFAALLEDPNVIKRGQNIHAFDSPFFIRRHGIRLRNVRDTMVSQGVLFPDFPKGLDFICSIHTKIPYYKDEGKEQMKVVGSWKKYWEYNVKDVLATAQSEPSIFAQLDTQDNIATAMRQNLVGEPCVAMHERGIRVDLEGMKMAREAIAAQLNDLSSELFKVIGREINVNSPQQLVDYFYGELKLTPYKDRKTGHVTTNADALKRLARKGIEEARILGNIRKLGKLLSTYLGGSTEGSSVESMLDPDGRLRCTFSPIGTATGRLSSKKTLDKTGMNLQNQPQEMRRFLLYDEGYIGYNMDLSQAENRIVAYVGPVPEMIECFERSMDVHSLTGSLISGIPPDEVKAQDKADIYAPVGSGNYTWRFWGKKCNHGLNYDEGYKTFAFNLEIPEKEGKVLVDAYHRSYPGVRNGFHQQVQNMLKTSRTVTNLMGRKRLFLDRWGDQLFKDAYAQIPQSTVADVINEYGLNYIYYNDIFKYLELLLQIHDSIMFQIPRYLPWSVHAKMLMLIKRSLEPELEWRGRKFVIPVDTQMSISHMAKIDNGLTDIQRDAFENEYKLIEALEATHGRLSS